MTAAQLIRIGGPRRNFVLLILACLATFFGVIFAFKGDAPVISADDPAISAPIELASTQVPKAPGTAPLPASSVSSSPRQLVAAPAPIQDSPSVEQVSPAAAVVQERPVEMVGADEANVRAAALRDLDPKAPDTFIALEQTIRYDAIARNRMLAVSGLRRMALGGANRERVTGVLRVGPKIQPGRTVSLQSYYYGYGQPGRQSPALSLYLKAEPDADGNFVMQILAGRPGRLTVKSRYGAIRRARVPNSKRSSILMGMPFF